MKTENDPQKADDTIVLVEEVEPEALAILNKSEIDQQVSTAKEYARSLTSFERRAREMACLNPRVAMACIYTLPRAGKNIVGPSVRFAEILASSFGNITVASRIIREEARFLTAQGVCRDLETNNNNAVEVRRRITNRDGKRYNDDMIAVTGMAAQAIAYRNVVYRTVPKALWEPIFEETKKIAAGDGATVDERRDSVLAHFKDLGIQPTRIYGALGVKGKADLTTEHIIVLGGYANSIKAGEVSVQAVFPDPKAVTDKPKTLDEVTERIKNGDGK